jgi:hypothetical protein
MLSLSLSSLSLSLSQFSVSLSSFFTVHSFVLVEHILQYFLSKDTWGLDVFIVTSFFFVFAVLGCKPWSLPHANTLPLSYFPNPVPSSFLTGCWAGCRIPDQK